MKNISIAFALILITGFAFAATQAQTRTSSGIKDIDFSNFSYLTTFGDPANRRTIKLGNGKFEDDGNLYELFDKPVYGDLNGDKSDEAIVEIKLSGGSYRAFEVRAYTFRGGAAKLLAQIDSDMVLKNYRKYYPKTDLHYAGVNPPKIQNGHVIVEALTEGDFACPKYTAIFDYRLSAGKFMLSSKPFRKNFKCSQ